jgi:hypothetical protein
VIGTVLLYIEHGDGAAVGHRALLAGDPCLAVVEDRRQRAVRVKLVGTHQDRLVPTADLVPAAPLTEEEEAEYRRLDAQLAGTMGEARTLKRFNGLRLRSLMFGGEQ